MSLGVAKESFANLLAGVPGMFVTARDGAIVVRVNEDASEDDRNQLKRLARNGWEGWKVKIEGVT